MDVSPLPDNQNAVGIDFGISHFAVTSDKDYFDNPRLLKHHLTRLKVLQQRLSRRTKGGKNWQKTRQQIGKLHAKIADCRQDFLHKFTTQIIVRYGHIITEDLGIINMMKNHRLAQAIGDIAWGEAIRQFTYKSGWYRRQYTQIDRFFPSSKRCHVCGHILEHLDLSTRSWICPECQTVHDRDHNASLNIKAVGQTASIYGQGVRLPKGFLSGAASCVVTTC